MATKNFNMSFEKLTLDNITLFLRRVFFPISSNYNRKNPNLATQKAMLEALEEREAAEYYDSPEALKQAIRDFQE